MPGSCKREPGSFFGRGRTEGGGKGGKEWKGCGREKGHNRWSTTGEKGQNGGEETTGRGDHTDRTWDYSVPINIGRGIIW